ncbi:MAG TPA: hypothetical protein VLE43_00810, partial [Candidatus Saccharimonadia bacterium]|nr:hypothetical protein [Candidatus Saccharimonadia bacterium]
MVHLLRPIRAAIQGAGRPVTLPKLADSDESCGVPPCAKRLGLRAACCRFPTVQPAARFTATKSPILFPG